jgi:lipid-binding SYLF domain-containing protein
MHFSSAIRVGFVALLALLVVGVATPSQAQTGSVRLEFVKAGWFVGGSAGSGTLNYQGRTYPLNIGGLSAGFTFGASKTTLVGTARNLRNASDITGTYAAVGAGATVAGGGRLIELRNSRGVVLSLQGASVGLSFDLDLSGMEITFR